MKQIKPYFLSRWSLKQACTPVLFAGLIFLGGCKGNSRSETSSFPVKLITVAPGHFHAALVQKSMYEDVDSVVHVYAQKGPELEAHQKLINKYNSQEESPTHWHLKVYEGGDFFEKMLQEKSGNVVVIAGNNQKKTEYIKRSVEAGLNVLADKPMAIDARGFEELKNTFEIARNKKVLLYDIMTERYEITSILQKELSQNQELFGELEKGTSDSPAVIKESIHHLYKQVSGSPLIRPSWFYDTEQQANGLVDVTTHLVDLIQWACFPGQALDYMKDIKMISARRWATPVSSTQFKVSTGQESYPDFLKKDLKDGVLQVFSNGEMNYALRGVHAKVSVVWNFQAPQGTGDTHYSIMRGTKCNIVIRQGKEQNYKPTLYVVGGTKEGVLRQAINNLEAKYPGIDYRKFNNGWELIIPDSLKVGHEEHFSQVTKSYLRYLKEGKLPAWEVPNMLAKYYTTTQALEMALKSNN